MLHSKRFLVLILTLIIALTSLGFGQEVKKIKVIKKDGHVNILENHGDCMVECDMSMHHGLGLLGLDLNEKQKEKVEAIHSDLEKVLLPIEADLKVRQAELNKLLIAEKPNKSMVNNKIDEIGALKVKMQKEKVGHRLEVRSMLDDKQRIRFDKTGGCCGSDDGLIHKKMMFIGEGGHDIDVLKLHHGMEGEDKLLKLMHEDGDHKVLKWVDEDGEHKVKKWVEEEDGEKKIRVEVETKKEK